jgi:hypothetical protein
MLLLQQPVLFERQVPGGEIQVVRQENLITKMEVDSHDTGGAKTTLITMRTLALHRQERRASWTCSMSKGKASRLKRAACRSGAFRSRRRDVW